MNTSALPWIGGAALATCALALAWSFQSGRDARAAAATATAPTDAAAAAREDELRQLREQIAALQAQFGEPARRASDAPAATVSPERMRRETEHDRQRQAAYVAGLQASFQLEPTDPRWSAATGARLLDALQRDEAMRGAARDLQCRSSSCRLELTLDAGGAVNKQLPLWSQQFADVLPRMVGQPVVRANGERAMVLYLLGPQPQPPPAAAPKG